MKLKLNIPNIAAPMRVVLGCEDRTVLIAAPRLDGPRTALLWWLIKHAIATPLAHQNFTWVTPNPDKSQSMLERILSSQIAFKSLWTPARSGRPDILGRNRSQIHVLKLSDLDTVDLPHVHSAVFDEGQQIENPHVWCAQAVTNFIRVLGYPTVEENWFTKIVNAPTPPADTRVVKVTINDELEVGNVSIQARDRLRKELGEERYQSEYLLKPTATDSGWTGKGFDQFIHDRLFVATDRDIALLSDRQRAYVRAQLGDSLPQENEQTGQFLVPFDLTLLQRRYLDIKRKAVMEGKRKRVLLLKARQSGFSTLEQAENYYTVATQARAKVLTLAHTDESTARIFGIANTFYENDPFKSPKRHDNARAIKLRGLESEFFIGTAGAKGFGRGFTLQRVHGSEVSQWGSGADRIQKVEAIMAGSILPACRNGTVVLETTANGIEWFCEVYREAKRGKNDWTPIFLPWFTDPINVAVPGTYNPDEIRDTLVSDEQELIARVRKDYNIELGMDAIAFRRIQQRETRRLFQQEYPEDDESCFLTSGTAYFSLERLLFLVKYWEKEYGDKTITHKKGMTWHFWEQPVPGHKYAIGADTSEGLPTSDPCGVGVMDIETGHQVASCHGLCPVPVQAEIINELHRKYNKAIMGVERNNHGHAVLNSLKEKFGHRGVSQSGYLFESKKRPGWDTNPASRPVMLSCLDEALTFRDEGWRDREFLEECRTFKLQDDGQFRADTGAHDDRVIKWAICEMMRREKRIKPGIHYRDLDIQEDEVEDEASTNF